jgi:hypothetical protein
MKEGASRLARSAGASPAPTSFVSAVFMRRAWRREVGRN